MHPLFGRRFTLLSVSTSPRAIGYASVIYQDHMQLRIPLSATHLAAPRESLGTKLTLESVTELVTVVHQGDADVDSSSPGLELPISNPASHHHHRSHDHF
jgi:hypothetical protein